MGRNALILVFGFAIITGIMRLALHSGERNLSQIAYDRYEDYTGRNAAHSGAHLALDTLRQDPHWRDGYTNLSIFNASVDVQVYDQYSDTTLGEDTLRIAGQGTIGGQTADVILKVTVDATPYLGNINAAITAQANITTLGDMYVDGRDHDWHGNLIPNNGTYAVVTVSQYIPGGNTWLAGTTVAGVDYGPVDEAWEPIVLENYVWPGGYPNTPEEVLGGAAAGLPPDFFKGIAISGYNGSQYVVDPNALTFPLHGVTYVELPAGTNWQPASLGDNGQGLLIVHNSTKDATMVNVNASLFRGLIITDDLQHEHADVIGAIFVLKDPVGGNCIGNGTGDVLFSRIALDKALTGSGMNLANFSILEYWE
jgi:hypothetical protein